jgi:hypothetical protein
MKDPLKTMAIVALGLSFVGLALMAVLTVAVGAS